MKKFFVLVKKEIKELLTPQMLVPLLAVMLVFVFIGKIVGKETAKTQSKQPIAMMDLDQTSSSAIVGLSLKKSFIVDEYKDQPVQDVISQAKSKNQRLVLVVPKGFEAGINQGQAPAILTYTVMKNFSFTGARATGQASTVLTAVNETISNSLISKKISGINPQELKNPVKNQDYVIIGDKQAQVSPAVVSGFISSQTTFIPIILFLVIVMASQLIATAIATEKENKTLETLLSSPVDRKAIVAAKLIGAGFVALLSAVIYLFGMRYYISGISGGTVSLAADAATKSALTQLGLVLTATDYVLLGLSLFFGILAALSIAIIMGSFAEDAKSAQGVTTPLMVLILIPYFLVMFLDVSSLPAWLKTVVYVIPFSHPFMAAPNLLLHQFANVAYGIIYMAIFFLIFVYIASRIFASDKILTMKLNFKKKR